MTMQETFGIGAFRSRQQVMRFDGALRRANIKSEIISTFVYKIGLGSGASNDYSYSTAIGMFNSVVNLLLISAVNWVSGKISENSLW